MMKIYPDEIERKISKDPAEIRNIVEATHPDDKKKTGFWLFDLMFQKDKSYLDFGSDSVWNPTYFIYTIDENVIGILSFRFKSPYKNDYVHIMDIQVLDEYKGNSIGECMFYDLKQYISENYPDIQGFTLQCYEPSLVNLYTKWGFAEDKELDSNVMSYKIHTKSNMIYPGGFKPFHDGHIYLIMSSLTHNPSNLTVLISGKDRGGLTAETSKWFIDQIFSKNKNFHSEIIYGQSPIRAAYNMTSTKRFGDGTYELISANKDSDIKRSDDFKNNFSTRGKYSTSGVIPSSHISQPLLYKSREDEFNDSPVSSTIIRDDLIKNDFTAFKHAYKYSIDENLVSEELLKEYFDRLTQEIIYPKIQESGAAGHINHPYEYGDMTFQEIMNMIDDIFNGKIDDITEKLDGMNIFASMDEKGRVIFARNKEHLKNDPMTLDDIKANSSWSMGVKQSFTRAAETIEKVFGNITYKLKGRINNVVEFFNWTDYGNHLKYRTWYNIEIIDHDSINVIPYTDNIVSFHTTVNTCEEFDDNGVISFDVFESPNREREMIEIKKAIDKTDKSMSKIQVTPKVIIETTKKNNEIADMYKDELEEFMDEHELSLYDTINDYRRNEYKKYLLTHENVLCCTAEDREFLANRWSEISNTSTKDLKNYLKPLVKYQRDEYYSAWREFEKNNLPKLSKRIMLPIDKFFKNLGNDVIKMCKNLTNSGHENDVIAEINKRVVKIIDEISTSEKKNDIDKLEYLLVRLGNDFSLNSSEGIVFNYHGKIFKLTGSFSALNQLLHIKKGGL